jgi:hypothetical protein
MIELSTGKSWAAVATAYQWLTEAHIDLDKAKPLLPFKPAPTRLEQIKDLIARLHKEIHYTGIEFGQASLQPATAGDYPLRLPPVFFEVQDFSFVAL